MTTNKKLIIDVACGGKMFLSNQNNPLVEFCDIREYETTLCDGRYFEVKPDTVCDFTNIPFADNTYKLVVFDPPHLLRNTSNTDDPTGWQHKKYGALYADWQEMLAKGFAECFRILEPHGILIFKWNETDIKVSEVLDLTDQKPLFGHKSGKRQNTHWICFMKRGGLE